MYSSDNLLYILTILEAIEKVKKYTNRFPSAKAFFDADDQLFFHATTNLLLTIGEESKKLEKGLKNEFPNIPWNAIAGMRNRLVHDHRGDDLNLVFFSGHQCLGETLIPEQAVFSTYTIKMFP